MSTTSTFRYTNICDIHTADDAEKNLLVVVTSKKDVAKFGDEQKRRRLNGVFGDESGSRIDFVAWDAVAEIINEKLLEGKATHTGL